jgi:hypothetical protein
MVARTLLSLRLSTVEPEKNVGRHLSMVQITMLPVIENLVPGGTEGKGGFSLSRAGLIFS